MFTTVLKYIMYVCKLLYVICVQNVNYPIRNILISEVIVIGLYQIWLKTIGAITVHSKFNPTHVRDNFIPLR